MVASRRPLLGSASYSELDWAVSAIKVEAGCLNLRIQISLFEVEIEEKAKERV